MTKGNSPTLMEKVFGEKVKCPDCGESKFLAKLETVAVDGKMVEVYRCSGGRFCKILAFGVLPDGTRVRGSEGLLTVNGQHDPNKGCRACREAEKRCPKTGEGWAIQVPPTSEQMVDSVKGAVVARFVPPLIGRARRFCPTLACAKFNQETEKPFCGRCGAANSTKAAGVVMTGLRLAVCENEACTRHGRKVNVERFNQWCESCGGKYAADTDKMSDVAAAIGGVR